MHKHPQSLPARTTSWAVLLTALVGCAPASTQFSTPDLQGRPVTGRKTQAVLSASLEHFELTNATYQTVHLQQSTGYGQWSYFLLKMVPLSEEASIPADIQTYPIKAASDGNPDHFQILEDRTGATHLFYVLDRTAASPQDLSAKLGGVDATAIKVGAEGLEMRFPVDATGSLTLAGAPGRHVTVDYAPFDQAQQIYTLVSSKVLASGFTTSTPRVAQLDFLVKQTDGTAVPGLTKANFGLSLYPNTPSHQDAPYDTTIDTLSELGDGKYRISAEYAQVSVPTGSIRVKIQVVNGPATTKASFYRSTHR